MLFSNWILLKSSPKVSRKQLPTTNDPGVHRASDSPQILKIPACFTASRESFRARSRQSGRSPRCPFLDRADKAAKDYKITTHCRPSGNCRSLPC